MAKKVAILGCGPAGLLAAHAANLNGCDFQIFSIKQKSPLYGAQYLHKPIPYITTDSAETMVRYKLWGTTEQYRKKVYGDEWDGTTSPEDLMETHPAWDIRKAYDYLWYRYQHYIGDITIRDAQSMRLDRFDMVLSTLPRKLWREPGDQFFSQRVWACGDAPELGKWAPLAVANDDEVICNGRDNPGWYRHSLIFGYSTIEWPYTPRPPVSGIALVEKPLSHTSKAASDFIHLGRYGKWQKGVLTTDAFDEAFKVTA